MKCGADIKKIEDKWQKYWQNNHTFKFDSSSTKPKYYVLEMLPYPSGKIHIGHLRNYTMGDVMARFKKSQGFEVIHPMGWDAFGLPAENAAREQNVHPAEWTYSNIKTMKEQMQKIGFSYDWDLEIATCHPHYYKFEQKMFLDFLSKGIAYKKESFVNWDPVDHTVLSNEQVIEGKGWRSGAIIERKSLSQWFLKITNYAEELLKGLDTLTNWPINVLEMQRKWIGKSEGCTIFFKSSDASVDPLEVYTTTPEAIFGATFLGISTSHPLALKLAKKNDSFKDFLSECNKGTISEEFMERAEKKGFDTGYKFYHPFNSQIILPLYVTNFILDTGTGAIFGCPGHDTKDFSFALKEIIPIIQIIKPYNETTALPYSGDGIMINSSFLDGLDRQEARKLIIKKIEEKSIGKATINYRLRDWGVSRQRYWGCPIPIIYCNVCGTVPVPDKDLPVELPSDVLFNQHNNPLDSHPTWKFVSCPNCKQDAVRETDTLDTFFESSWYFTRYLSPRASEAFDKKIVNKFLPVDQYIGGIEHAVLHLLYSRFFIKALRDCDYLSIDEPFFSLLTQGMVCHETYQDKDGKWLYPFEVEKHGNQIFSKKDGSSVKAGRIEKMSKSKKNTITIENILEKNYGVDAIRLCMMSDTPCEKDLVWKHENLEGATKYINKLFDFTKNFVKNHSYLLSANINESSHPELMRLLHKTIVSVTKDFQTYNFNTAIAKIREYTNSLFTLDMSSTNSHQFIHYSLTIVIQLLNPLIPHITEELWEMLGYNIILANYPWPSANADYLIDTSCTIAIQINGKFKTSITIERDYNNQLLEEKVLGLDTIKKFILNQAPKKVIIIPNRIVNVII